jgi:uncharacterized protein with PIN domain
MLGRLARWMRVLGYDTLNDPALDDRALVALANAEDRVVLTRDRRLLRDLRPARQLEITSERPLEQLRAVIDACALTPPAELFTRCLLCNAILDELPRDEARSLLPSNSRDLPGPTRRCPRCGRVYWLGSHARRMRETLRHALPLWFAETSA